ncbi:MAG: adenosine deaminase [Anaerolineae bacterium]
MNTSLHDLPKIELHRHLEGSWRLETLCDLAHEYCLPLKDYEPTTVRPFVQIMPEEPHTMEQFLSKFRFLRQFFRSETIIKRAAREAVIDAAQDNIRYMELRFTPQALNNIMHCDYGTVIEWVCDVTQAAAAEKGITVKLIVSMNRHESLEIGQAVLEAALAYKSRGVVGLDLAGQEAGFPPQPFQSIFERAKAEGLGVTIHAGEWSGAQSVNDAVYLLGADRIGHGIRVLEDPELAESLARRGTTFEVCPTSNFHSGAVISRHLHPFHNLRESGLRVTINTDDPLICGISLTDELIAAQEMYGYTRADLKQLQVVAAQAAFISPAEREALVRQFEAELE